METKKGGEIHPKSSQVNMKYGWKSLLKNEQNKNKSKKSFVQHLWPYMMKVQTTSRLWVVDLQGITSGPGPSLATGQDKFLNSRAYICIPTKVVVTP